jgi:hypothetical protein
MKIDDELRGLLFEIVSRPGDGEPLWRDCAGAVRPQSKALELARGNTVESLRLKQAAREKASLRN